MEKIDLSNPVMALAMLTQQITELEKDAEANKIRLSECLQKRGGLLMAMGDKDGAGQDMRRFLELNPEKVGQLNGEFKAEGREHCH